MRVLEDFLIDGAPHVTAVSSLCKRARFPRSGCRRCADACAAQAIALDPVPRVLGGCADCGLCLVACPTEAFRDERHGDENILNRALSLARGSPASRALWICCARVEAAPAGALRVACTGRITETILVGLALAGLRELVVAQGECGQCRHRGGQELFREAVSTAGQLLRRLGREAPLIRSPGEVAWPAESAGQAPEVSRREFFSDLSRSARGRVTGILSAGETMIQAGLGNRAGQAARPVAASRRSLLRWLLRQTSTAGTRPARLGPGGPWARPRVDGQRCSGCGLCAAVCPTGALRQQIEAEHTRLQVLISACTRCALCAEACPQRAVGLDDTVSLAEVLAEEPVVVARIHLTTCVTCGDAMAGESGERCSTCRKRHLWPAPGGPQRTVCPQLWSEANP